MLFAKLCKKGKINPNLNILRKILNKNENESVLSIQNFKIDYNWTNIIHEIIKDETNFKYMVKKLILKNNHLKSKDFTYILKALFNLEGLESIIYH